MAGVNGFFLRVLMWAAWVAGLFAPVQALAECGDENVLKSAAIVESRGVNYPSRLSDGWTAPDGSPHGVHESAIFSGKKPHVTWELSELTSIGGLDIQADHDDSYLVLGSLDGKRFETLWEVPRPEASGLQSRSLRGPGEKVRFLRVVARGGDGAYAVSELRAYCRLPSPWPPARLLRLSRVANPEAVATYNAFSGKLVVALVGLFLVFVLAPRLRGRWRDGVLYSVIAMSALGWTHFGQFQGKTLIHTWDMFHYYVGSKYYEELGYLDLYRCIAKADRERGRTDGYQGVYVRDLDDNTMYPFSWTDTEAGRCRAEFEEDEWREFNRDLDAFRAIMVNPPFEHVVGDHGFNATPFHATWLSAVTTPTHASKRTLRVLAQIDSMALLVAVFALTWGFGLPVAAVAALLIQVADPWSYNWVGGGLGRHVWFALSCIGLALLKQKCHGRGTAALTVAALLRLFPLVLLGGLGLYYISEWIRARRLSTEARRALGGFALTVAMGSATVLISYGPAPFARFVDVILAHADAPASNRMGLPHLLSLGPGKGTADLVDARLTDPAQPWRETVHITRRERKPLWIFAIVASLGVLVWAVWTLRSPWISALAAGPLLYSMQEMTSYDYMWLVLLLPVAFRRKRALWWLCGFALFTQVIGIVVPDVEHRHWYYAVALMPTMVVFALELVQWGRLKWRPSAPCGRGAAAPLQ